MKYILIEENVVKEIIQEVNPAFPGIPIRDRYTAEFLAQCLPVREDVEVEPNWLYDPETGQFEEPPVEEVPEEPDEGEGDE